MKYVPVQMINEENKSGEILHPPADRLLAVASIWEAALASGFPVAVWRLPESSHVILIVSENRVPDTVTPDLEKLENGFLMAPFEQTDDENHALFLQGTFSVAFELKNPFINLHESEVKGEFAEELLQRAELLERDRNHEGEHSTESTLSILSSEGADDYYRRIVQIAADKVKAGALFKVVLSRTKEFETKPGFSPIRAFLKLESAYPSAFISLVSLPHTGEMWMGASPEILVGVTEKRYFKTVALAGTQSATDETGALKPRSRVLWSEKEIEEQAIVSRYIIGCFKRIRLREYEESGPRSVKAGNLYHLKSDFDVDLAAVNFPELGSVMLKLLHPTSAVCGMPRKDATALINVLESHERSFYSGYWGPVNIEGDSALFVNLRTLRIKKDRVTLFAGAGITADSDPDEEWKETELKCDTLLSVIDPTVTFKKVPVV